MCSSPVRLGGDVSRFDAGPCKAGGDAQIFWTGQRIKCLVLRLLDQAFLEWPGIGMLVDRVRRRALPTRCGDARHNKRGLVMIEAELSTLKTDT